MQLTTITFIALISLVFGARLNELSRSLSVTNTPKMTILAGTAVTSTGFSTVSGNVGVSPGSSMTGFGPATLTGEKYLGVTESLNAQLELGVLYNHLEGLPCQTVLTGVDLGGKTLKPGVYCFATGASISGNLFLDSDNVPSPYWVFQMGTTLLTSIGSKIIFTKMQLPCNVFWKVGSSATISAGSDFKGNVVAYTSIALNTGAKVTGKLMAKNGAVTMISNTIVDCGETLTPVLERRNQDQEETQEEDDIEEF
jgi:hypothetical protein